MPELLLRSFGGKDSDVSRRAFEALVANQYRTGNLTHFEVSQLLGIDRFETDGFLKQHAAFRPSDSDEFKDDYENLKKLMTE